MGWIDWLIVIIPTAFVMGLGMYSRKYVHGVADFLSAGRCAGRYVLSMGDVASALAVTGLIAYVEVHYKTGFAVAFWNSLISPLGIALGLYGYCTYRFRETRAMSLGQFLEMRYNRKFRIFASALRSISEMLANMIMPAIAARFFIYFLDLPHKFEIFGITVPTFMLIIIICLILAISLICFGGTLSMLIADSVQGMVLFPLMVVFVVFILWKFSWTGEIIPVMSDRVPGESFLNSFDVKNLRDFNLLMVFLTVFTSILHRASWIGAGYTTAAKSPHEQKMAGVLGTWRGALNGLFYLLIALGIITILNHQNFSKVAREVKINLSEHIAEELVAPANRVDFITRIKSVPEMKHEIGKDAPLSHKKDLDTPYMEVAHKAFKEYEGEAEGNSKFQQYRTLYYQLMMATGMHRMLPPVIMGMFCLLMILAMISTDDSRIFSATITISQDVILPFIKKQLTPSQHMWMLRGVAIGIGVFFFLGSKYMAQLDFINLYVTLVCSMWLGGCGPVIVFGLYSRFGTTLGAWASLLNGMFMAAFGVFVQRNWADVVYPWLAQNDLTGTVGNVLETVSKPLNPIIVWKMNEIKCPINSYEWYFITMVVSLIMYFLFSALSRPEQPFNLERMLHRGKYALDGQKPVTTSIWTKKNLFNKFVGINSEYTFWDKVIAWSYFSYSIIYGFFGTFIVVIIWNLFYPWPTAWWGVYFLITFMIVPGILAAITAVWVTAGGVIDLRAMFRDLNNRVANHLDNGQVEGNMSLADKAELEAVDKKPGQEKKN